VISAIAACIILGIMSFKFFAWYRTNRRNLMVLFYGLAAATIAIAITEDVYTKLIVIHLVEEKTPAGVASQSSFIYKTLKKYQSEIQYKVMNPHNTLLWISPTSTNSLKNNLDQLQLLPYIFMWLAVATLLRQYYKSIKGGDKRFPLKFWAILAVPLILYLIGSNLILSTPADTPYKYYYRVIYRSGTIGASLLFAVAFYVAARNIAAVQVKDYLAISAIGIIMVRIALSISALQQTYGVAAHSIILLSSYLFVIGFYALAISISHDRSLRQSIRSSALEVSKLLDVLGTPNVEQEIERRVLSTARKKEVAIVQQSGVESSLTENEMKRYLGTVLKEIKILKNIDEIITKGKEILNRSYEFLVCSGFGGLRLAYNNYFDLYKKVMEKHKNGEHKGIRIVTSIADKDNANLVHKFVDIGIHVRHAKNMPPIDFAVSDKELIANIEKAEGGEKIRSLLVSNEYSYVSHFVSIFEELWKNGADAIDRIRTIEEGLEPEIFEVISDNQKAAHILIDLANSVSEEALFLLPVDRAMIRVDNLGVIDHLIKASQNGANIKIICPLTEENSHILKKISKNAPDIKILNGHDSSAGFLIADGKRFIRAELKNAEAIEFSEAIGFTLYSTSKRSVESFKSVFELLWNEHLINDQLKKTEELQNQFINIAAHELRTPIQPILALSEVVRSKINDPDLLEMLDITIKNARRLRRLTDDILDASKIESLEQLQLNKERFNLTEIMADAIADSRSQITTNKKSNVSLDFLFAEQDILIEGDKSRINQVVMNLISNAIKFTKEGRITITTEKTADGLAIISIKDTGSGIDPEIMPRLFTKFTTKSDKGTGLGLFISKSIVEAHGGKIWAINNMESNGALFAFSLPIAKQEYNTTSNFLVKRRE
jgi:signal transduction histidine kinase